MQKWEEKKKQPNKPTISIKALMCVWNTNEICPFFFHIVFVFGIVLFFIILNSVRYSLKYSTEFCKQNWHIPLWKCASSFVLVFMFTISTASRIKWTSFWCVGFWHDFRFFCSPLPSNYREVVFIALGNCYYPRSIQVPVF